MMPKLPNVYLEIREKAGRAIDKDSEAVIEGLLRDYGCAVAEACAAICEQQISGDDYHFLAKYGHFDHMAQSATNCAAAIREAAKEIGAVPPSDFARMDWPHK